MSSIHHIPDSVVINSHKRQLQMISWSPFQQCKLLLIPQMLGFNSSMSVSIPAASAGERSAALAGLCHSLSITGVSQRLWWLAGGAEGLQELGHSQLPCKQDRRCVPSSRLPQGLLRTVAPAQGHSSSAQHQLQSQHQLLELPYHRAHEAWKTMSGLYLSLQQCVFKGSFSDCLDLR